MGDPWGAYEGKECLEEDRVRPDIRYCDVDGQRDYPGAFDTQRDQFLPSIAYRCPIPGTGGDCSAPIPADVGQRDDRPGIAVGDEGGAKRDYFRRDTIDGS